MDDIFHTLRTSTNNDARREARRRLCALQESQPNLFLDYTWNVIASPAASPSSRFFNCTVLLEFLRNRWRAGVAHAVKEQMLTRYVDLVMNGPPLPSQLLIRNVGHIIALMVHRGRVLASAKGQSSLISMPVSAYRQALQQAATELSNAPSPHFGSAERVALYVQWLILLHMLLRELSQIKVLSPMQSVCAECDGPLSALLTTAWQPHSLHYILSPHAEQQHVSTVSAVYRAYYVHLFKCVYRVYGGGVLHVSVMSTLLSIAWDVARRLNQRASWGRAHAIDAKQHGGEDGEEDGDRWGAEDAVSVWLMRVLEYVLKTLQSRLISHIHHHSKLPPSFYYVDTQSGGAAKDSVPNPVLSATTDSLFGLLHAIIVSRASRVFSEKVLTRAMNLLCFFFRTYGNGTPSCVSDSMVYAQLDGFAQDATMDSLMTRLVLDYFGDEVSARALRTWQRQPESAAEAMGDACNEETTPVGAAEFLFLELTNHTSAPEWDDVVGGGGGGGTGPPVLVSQRTLQQAWRVVNRILASGSVREVTSALHALGVAHATMGYVAAGGAENDAGNDDYMQFLRTRLMPVLQRSVSAAPEQQQQQQRPDYFIQLRVMWLVGMWCCSVKGVHVKREIHAALEAVLLFSLSVLQRSASPSAVHHSQAGMHELVSSSRDCRRSCMATESDCDGAMVVCSSASCAPLTPHGADGIHLAVALVALNAMENFVSDDGFVMEELTQTWVPTVMQAVSTVVPCLTYPHSIRRLALLIYSIGRKSPGLLCGRDMLRVFHPVMTRMMDEYVNKLRGPDAGSSSIAHRSNVDDDDNDDAKEDASSKLNWGALDAVLSCLEISVQSCCENRRGMTTPDVGTEGASCAVWDLLPTVVLPCTTPGAPLAPFAEYEAWNLLAKMTQGTALSDLDIAPVAQAAEAAMRWILQNITTRDFEAMPHAVRALHPLLLLRYMRCSCVEEILSAEQVRAWLQTMRSTEEQELASALFALLMAVVRTSAGSLREHLIADLMMSMTAGDCDSSQAACVPQNHGSAVVKEVTLLYFAMQCAAAVHVPCESSAPGLPPTLAPEQRMQTSMQQWVAPFLQRSESNVSRYMHAVIDALKTSHNRIATYCAVQLLTYFVRMVSLSAHDAACVHEAVSQSTHSTQQQTAVFGGHEQRMHNDDHDDDDAYAEYRSFDELLMELLEEQSVPATSPHAHHILTMYQSLNA